MTAGNINNKNYKGLVYLGALLIATSCVLPASSGPTSRSYDQESLSEATEVSKYQGDVFVPSDYELNQEQFTIPVILDKDFSLSVGNSWIYLVHDYPRGREASLRISDTIINVILKDGYVLAEVSRKSESLLGEETANLESIIPPDDYWWISDGTYLYYLDDESELNHLSEEWLELRFPIDECLLPDLVQRKDIKGVEENSRQMRTGCWRKISETAVFETPDYLFEDCIQFELKKSIGFRELVYCPEIGIVKWGFKNLTGSEGYDVILSGYSINSN